MGRDRLGGRGHVRRENLLRARAGEGRPRRQQLVGHHAEGVEVGAVTHLRIGHRLLRGHVGRRAQRDAHRGERLPPGRVAQRLGHAEIHDQCMAAAEHHVLGLEVAVDHAVAVGFGERIGDVAEDPHRVADGQLARLGQLVAKGEAVDVGHDVEEQPIGGARVVQRQDVGVLQRGRHLDLAEEALFAERGGELLAQDLHGDLAVVLEVVREIDRGHAPRAELALDAVAVGQGEGEPVERLSHAVTARGPAQSRAGESPDRGRSPATRQAWLATRAGAAGSVTGSAMLRALQSTLGDHPALPLFRVGPGRQLVGAQA